MKLFQIAADIALRRSHEITAASVLATMKTLNGVDLGVCAPLSFTRRGPLPGAPRVVNTEVFYSEVEHGVLTDLGSRPHSLL